MQIKERIPVSLEPNFDGETRVTALNESPIRGVGEDCLVIIHAPANSALGMRFVLNKPAITIGRNHDNDIILPSDCVSRRHGRIELRDDQFHVVDLNSTNGTYSNDAQTPVSEHCLKRGDQIKIGDTIFKYLSGMDVEAQYHEIIFQMTITDGLTNLSNRKQLDQLLIDEISRSRRHARAVSVLMIDIDHFKKINDTYGHLAGDTVLRSLAGRMQKRLRPHDKLGRYGGEEFCAILPETSLSSAAHIAEQLRTMTSGDVFVAEGKQINVTISIGIATLVDAMGMEDLYRRADEMLYLAKRNGRNQTRFE